MFQFLNGKGQQVSFTLGPQGVEVSRPGAAPQTVPIQAVIGVNMPVPTPPGVTPGFNFDFRYFLTKEVTYERFGIPTLKDRSIVVLALVGTDPGQIIEFREAVLRLFYASDPNGFQPRRREPRDEVYYKKACVLINPNSGKKQAASLWAFAKPSFLANGIWPVEVVSTHAGHTVEFIQGIPKDELLSFDFFLCVSGDGTPFEVINAFMRREDVNHEGHVLSLQMLPAGSGCALLENNMKLGGATTTLENAIHSAVNLRKSPHALQEYQLLRADGQVEALYGFMTAQHGFFADVDIESEFLRFMGWYRFDVYGTLRLACPTKYNNRICLARREGVHLPPITQPVLPAEGDDGVEVFAGNMYSFYMAGIEYFSRDYHSSPSLRDRPGWLDVQIFPSSLGRVKFTKYLLRHKDYKVPNSIGLEHRLTKELRLEFNVPADGSDPLFVIDGESLRSKRLRAIQVKVSDRKVNFLI